MLITLLVFIFAGTYFGGDRNDLILRLYIFADSPSKCCKNPQNWLKMTEFSKITFSLGTYFGKLCQKRQNPRKSIPVKINTNKVPSDALYKPF